MDQQSKSRFASLSLLFAFVALLAGCATPASYQGMVPASVDIAKKHNKSVSVSVSGGQETSGGGKPQISNEAFSQALTQAITTSQVFSSAVPQGGDYQLTVAMISMQQPSFGLSFTVTLEAGWTLKRGDAVVWQEAIKSSFTATTSDAFAAVTRLRLATEGAAKENIKAGLSKISKLNL